MEIDGKKIASRIEAQLKQEVTKMRLPPALTVISVGRNPASLAYIRQKEKKSREIGIRFHWIRLPASVSLGKLLKLVARESRDPQVSGVIVQLPLPRHLDAAVVLDHLDPAKDVDGLHAANLGQLFYGRFRFLPATVAGIWEIIRALKLKLAGRRVALVGFTPLVNMPLALLLGQAKATVIVLQEKERFLNRELKRADLVISAVGKSGLIRGEAIKKGAVVIDVGISRVGGKLLGDVEFAKAKQRASFITPVPGGVGPLTVVCLLRNVVLAAKNRGLTSQRLQV